MTATAQLQPQPLGAMIDKFYDLREQKRQTDAESAKISAEMNALEAEILQRLDADASTMSRGSKASAILVEAVVPQVTDWEQFYEYILDNNAFHLLQRRASIAPFREMHEAGEEIPGVSPYNRRTISLRKNTK